MGIEKSVPEIRFKGFSGDWETRGMLDCSSKIGDGLHGTPKYTNNTGIYFINGNNLVSGSISITNETKQVSTEEQSKDDKSLDFNTLLLSINGTIGNLAWYRGQNVMLGKSVAFITLENCDNSYMYTYLQTARVNNYFLNNLTGSTIKNLGLKAIRESIVLIPKEKPEQTQIGNFFQNLDSLINHHQQKHDKLSNIKNAMLEKMFPKKGETIPEIRFKGFSGEWKKVPLSSAIDVRSGKDYKHLGKGGIPVYGTGGYMLSVDSALSLDEDAIGIGRKGTIDKPYILRAPFWTVDTLFYAVPFPSFKLDFLFCLFQKIEWKNHDESTGVPSLSKVAINNVRVFVTSDKEQAAIGNYFQKIDTLINHHQQQINKLNSIKQACLSKMFV